MPHHQRSLGSNRTLHYSYGRLGREQAYIELLVECFIYMFGWYDQSPEGILLRASGKDPTQAYKTKRRAEIRQHVRAHQHRLLHFIGTQPVSSDVWTAYISSAI